MWTVPTGGVVLSPSGHGKCRVALKTLRLWRERALVTVKFVSRMNVSERRGVVRRCQGFRYAPDQADWIRWSD